MGIDTTMSPTWQLPTLSPSSTTSAANSWPITTSWARSMTSIGRHAVGRRSRRPRSTSRPSGRRARSVCRSDPQMPQARVRTRTWPGPGVGSATSSTTSSPPRMTAACIGPPDRSRDVLVAPPYRSATDPALRSGDTQRRSDESGTGHVRATGRRPSAEPRSSGGARSSTGSPTTSCSGWPSSPTTSRPRPGAVLVDQGRVGQECYVILDGQAGVYVGGEHIATVGPGSMVGEMALLEHSPATPRVVAETPMKLLAFDTRHFKQLLEEMPKAHDRVMEIAGAPACRRTRATDGRAPRRSVRQTRAAPSAAKRGRAADELLGHHRLHGGRRRSSIPRCAPPSGREQATQRASRAGPRGRASPCSSRR